MINWAHIFTPLALSLSQASVSDEWGLFERGGGEVCSLSGADQIEMRPAARPDPWLAFQPWRTERNPMQTRVEQRIIIRISPARPRPNALPQQMPRRVVEQKMGKCVALRDIVAVQTGGPSKLILFLDDRRMISAQLPKTCSARDFYSGFYVEPSEDGNLCTKRDRLQSRNGTKCQISSFSQLVPA
ncbi:MAG: hypothetical protein HKO05_03200 [Erythrobacter sp.]|nr:hypothetical protein [Erythrobacter sp.]